MERGSPESFTRMGTLGIEEECFVVDERGRPTSGTDELVYEHDPPEILADRLDHELFKFVIETQTPLIENPDDARDALLEIRQALVEHAQEHGYEIAAAGLHPLAKWRELEHAEKPRYRSQLDRIQYPQHRNTTAGVHVHVGVDDADKAVWIANELRWYVPIMLALSANSPYWNGFDTGLQSARAKIFEGLPNTGMPTYFEDFAAFDRFERRMLETGSINDRGELWYDVRPHTAHGTVELRTPDGQANPDVVMAFVEYAHALVEALAEEYEDGAAGYGHDHRRELLDEHKWRAIRYGHDASLLDREMEDTVDLGELVDRECERLGVDGIKRVYERESGAQKQRRLLEEEGSDALCESLLLQVD
ncbi:glutamate--cysteine ligase [Halopiger xanaduensis]|uniref:Glutamate--cysteine ligase n=1 Tax=Halopiger xanaduensis (strain DSM 18323 / JCM 14033 / SH-6) TaxID=797210 RepID=F8D8C6_HALXS|nr:glutamate--cysteine ligase [Halopiger xanaduensis]AEH35549.1 Carboxylate-amine ligase ybdK [Halopiger xanaduensis SH-6]